MGNILHEVLHSLGATHEQNREDRDKFVRIVEDDILEDSKKNFKKKDDLFSSYGTPYDYESIMHYNEDAFSVSGNNTIIPLQPNTTLTPVSSKSGLSTIDTMELARVYSSLTVSDCYTRDSLMEYLSIVEDKLNNQQYQCQASNPAEACLQYKEHTEFTTGSLNSASMIQSASSCHSLCQSVTECTRWSWNRLRERCYLKTGSELAEQQKTNFVSGLRDVHYCSG
eukprot:GFUD01045151.1.p1 GENE.GFUD01045151.1~~GFUD01045151.1.p1  ORF type:complete len:237 (-),score=62.52 GFUD01045151.1:186-860(-)